MSAVIFVVCPGLVSMCIEEGILPNEDNLNDVPTMAVSCHDRQAPKKWPLVACPVTSTSLSDNRRVTETSPLMISDQ